MIAFDTEDGRAGGDEIDAFLKHAAARAAAENDEDLMLTVLVAHLTRQTDAMAALLDKTIRAIEGLERRVVALEK